MKLTKREKTLLYILLCVIVFVGGIFLLIMPAFQKSLTLENSYQTAKSKLQETKASVKNYDNLDQEIEEINQRLSSITAKFYSTMEYEDVDKIVTELALNHYLEPTSLNIAEVKKEEVVNYKEFLANAAKKDDGSADANKEVDEDMALDVYNVTLTVDGNISNLQTLIDVANESRSMKINSVSYADQSDENKSMQITFKIFMIS